MKDTGMVRKVDELGRIVLPKELRKTLEIHERDTLEIYVDGSSVVLRKHLPGCVLCGEAANVLPVGGKLVCVGCARKLAAIVNGGAIQ